MTPLRLELSGFTVFRTATTLDLEGLDLFAIAGPTGSGKSTLLDALTYALYGQTARLGAKGLDVLLSPGLSQMYVRLDFRTARGTYRVTRTADRKPSGKVDRNTRIEELSPGAKWRQLPESEKLKEADAKLEALVGLDYDGFTRSVLLPQGAFDEFLRGDSGKRRRLLVNLLGLDRVEAMQKTAGRRYRAAEAAVTAIRERLDQDYAGATPERRRDLKRTLEAFETQTLELSTRQAEVAELLKALEEVKGLVDERSSLAQTLATLAAKAGEMSEKRGRLELARRAQLIAPQIEGVEAARAKTKRAAEDLARLGEARSAKEKALHAAQETLEAARSDADGLPALETRLAALAGVAPLMAQLKARGGTLALASEAAGAPYSEEAWDALRSQEMALPRLREAEKTLAEAEREANEAKTNLSTLEQDEAERKQTLETTLEAGKEAKARLEAARSAYERAVLEDRAGALREHLHLGEPCPVCEQTVAVLPPARASQLGALKEATERAETQRAELLETYQTLKAALSTAQNRIKDTAAALAKAQTRARNAGDAVTKLRAEFGAPGDGLETALAERKRALLAELAAQIHAQTSGEDPAALQESLQAQKKALETKLKGSEATFQEAKAAFERLNVQRDERQTGLAEMQMNLTELEASLTSALSTAQFATLEAARAALLREAEMASLEAELSAFTSRKESAERRDVELQAKLGGRSLDETRYAALKTESADLAARLGELRTDLGRAQAELQQVERQLEKAKELRKQLGEQQEIYDTYRLLSLDLRGNEFQEYLLAQVQAKLARRASHIIRDVTDGRYDLRLEDGDYQVRDAWTTGELRNAKTLSGGETFIASLALALALSDTIAGSHALGALFLDEGFGTLDAQTLNSVAEVLENLTREGRMVGVITHVRELTERLPARLSVRKGVEGSTVSWDL